MSLFTSKSRFFSGALSLLALSVVAAIGCENAIGFEPNGTTCYTSADCEGDEFCNMDSLCEAECDSCGNECEEDEDCPYGQFCDPSAGSCQRECEPEDEDSCGDSMRCTEDGQCVARDDIIVGPGLGGAGGSSPKQECIEVEVKFSPQVPNVVLLIDHSGSMDGRSDFSENVDDAISAGTYSPWDCGDDYDWRWNVARNVLLHPDTGVIKPLEDKVRFGYVSYTGEPDSCPLLESVEIDFGTHADMLTEFQCSEPLNDQDTPTRESLTQVAEDLAAMDLDGPKVIVLVTDGSPDNCTCNNFNQAAGPDCASVDENRVERDGMMLFPADAEQYDVILEAQRIHDELGITVEVINFSSESQTALAEHLDQVAARGGAASGASIPGFSPGALTEAFTSIVDGVRSCVIDLDGTISAGGESSGTIQLDVDPSDEVEWEELQLDDPDGWRVNSPTQIELLGEACEVIKSGDHELDISFPCQTFIPR